MLAEGIAHQLDHLIPSLQEFSTISHLSKGMSLQLRSTVFSAAKLRDTLGAGLILCPEIGLLTVSPAQNQEVQKYIENGVCGVNPRDFSLAEKSCDNPS